MVEKLAYSPAEAAQVLGISRPTIYTLLNQNDFPSFHVGSRVLVSVDGLKKWVEKQAEGGESE